MQNGSKRLTARRLRFGFDGLALEAHGRVVRIEEMTRWPVSAAAMAALAVSTSSISEIRMTSVSCRKAPRTACA